MPTSATAQDMALALDDIRENVAAVQAENTGVHAALAMMAAELQGLSHMLGKEYQLRDQSYGALISPNTPIKLDRQGRRFLLLFSAVPVASVAVDAAGTKTTLTLAAGWNTLYFADGTYLTGATGTSQQVIVLATNFVAPDRAQPVGPTNVALVSTAPTTTNAGSDTPLAFANPVAHWTLQNNSAINVYYNMDAAASTASLVLAPGGQAFYDWPISTLHVYTASAIAVNGASGLQLTGRV